MLVTSTWRGEKRRAGSVVVRGANGISRSGAPICSGGNRLGLGTLADFDGMLPRVEKEMRDLHAEGKAGKTLANYEEAPRLSATGASSAATSPTIL